jgi:hypothetical protein
MPDDRRTKRVFALLREGKIHDRDARLRLFSWITFREVTTTNDLSTHEIDMIINVLDTWHKAGELAARVDQYSA